MRTQVMNLRDKISLMRTQVMNLRDKIRKFT